MITAVFFGGPLDAQVLSLTSAPDVYVAPDGSLYKLRPTGRAHVRYEYRRR